MHSNTFLIKSDPQVLLKIKFAQNFDPQTLLKLSHKRYSKLLKISFTNITQNYLKLVSNLPKKRYSNWPFIIITIIIIMTIIIIIIIGPQTLLKLTHKRYSKLLKISFKLTYRP